MLLVIDNYDSFTYNLVQLLGSLGSDPFVVRNDDHDVDALLAIEPTHVVVSPGPCTPAEAGVSVEAVLAFGEAGVPTLGVCLGHQSLGEAYGGRTVRARRVMHGKVGAVRHDGRGIFAGIPSPFQAARYHSLVTDVAALPEALVPVAWSAAPEDEGEVQAMRHAQRPQWGVQFHPESLFGQHGRRLLENFLEISPASSGVVGERRRAG